MTSDAVARLEAVASRLEAVAARLGGGGGGDDDDLPFWVADYENIVKTQVSAAAKATDALGVPEMGALLQNAYANNLELVRRAPLSKKPSPTDMMAFLKPGIDAIQSADSVRYKGKQFKKYGDHYKAMYEAILIVSWVTMAPPNGLPAQHVEGQVQSCDFNLTRIQRRDKDPKTKAWIAAMKALNVKVKEFVKSNFKSGGLTWNPKGSSLSDASPGQTSGNSNSNSADDQKQSAPSKSKKSKKSKKGAGMGDVFSQLNKGMKITTGMNKVTASMKTKNRADRPGKVVMKAAKKKTRKKYGPPSTALRGFRWMIENYEDGIIAIEKPTLKQNLFISMCDTCTINVTAPKVKAVCIDSCVKVRVFLNDVVSSVEIVNCQSVTIVLQGVTPSISVDKTESAEVVLTKASYLQPPVLITSNISAMNLSLPGATEDDDNIHLPVPEQFVTKIDNKTNTIKTVATEH